MLRSNFFKGKKFYLIFTWIISFCKALLTIKRSDSTQNSCRKAEIVTVKSLECLLNVINLVVLERPNTTWRERYVTNVFCLIYVLFLFLATQNFCRILVNVIRDSTFSNMFNSSPFRHLNCDEHLRYILFMPLMVSHVTLDISYFMRNWRYEIISDHNSNRLF